MKDIVIVTGSDEGFADFLLQAIDSLAACDVLKRADLGVLDLGLAASTLQRIEAHGGRAVRPEWPDFVPTELRNHRQLGLLARPLLRDLFPGYKAYVWFDADAWAQDGSFLDRYVHGALTKGAAVALETGAGYRQSLRERRWWVGNHFLAFGALKTLRLVFPPVMNIGLLALSSGAPHWDRWSSRYAQIIRKTGKVNLDQHAFNAAVHLDKLDTEFLPATDNWQPILSAPVWDASRSLLCEPGGANRPISVVHLAGPDKTRNYKLPGSTVDMPLSYNSVISTLKPHRPN
jgi:hypothetical protein